MRNQSTLLEEVWCINYHILLIKSSNRENTICSSGVPNAQFCFWEWRHCYTHDLSLFSNPERDALIKECLCVNIHYCSSLWMWLVKARVIKSLVYSKQLRSYHKWVPIVQNDLCCPKARLKNFRKGCILLVSAGLFQQMRSYKASVQKCLYSECRIAHMLAKKSKTLEASCNQVAFETAPLLYYFWSVLVSLPIGHFNLYQQYHISSEQCSRTW